MKVQANTAINAQKPESLSQSSVNSQEGSNNLSRGAPRFDLGDVVRTKLDKAFENQPLQYALTTKSGYQLQRTTPHDHSWIVRASEDMIIYPHKTTSVETDLLVYLPESIFLHIEDHRRTIEKENSFKVVGGFLDQFDSGNLRLILENPNLNLIWIRKGDPVANLVVSEIGFAEPVLVSFEDLNSFLEPVLESRQFSRTFQPPRYGPYPLLHVLSLEPEPSSMGNRLSKVADTERKSSLPSTHNNETPNEVARLTKPLASPTVPSSAISKEARAHVSHSETPQRNNTVSNNIASMDDCAVNSLISDNARDSEPLDLRRHDAAKMERDNNADNKIDAVPRVTTVKRSIAEMDTIECEKGKPDSTYPNSIDSDQSIKRNKTE